MEILIQPTIDNLREELGYDDYDVNEDDLLFQQGYEGDVITVEDGEKFEIPQGYIGSIINDDNVYYMKHKIAEGCWEKIEFYSNLDAGSYMLSDYVISLVGKNDDFNHFCFKL